MEGDVPDEELGERRSWERGGKPRAKLRRGGDGKDRKGKREAEGGRQKKGERCGKLEPEGARERASPLRGAGCWAPGAGQPEAPKPGSPPRPTRSKGERPTDQFGLHKTRAPGVFARPLGLDSFLD